MAGLKTSGSQTRLLENQDERYLNFVSPASLNRDSSFGISSGMSLTPKARYDLD